METVFDSRWQIVAAAGGTYWTTREDLLGALSMKDRISSLDLRHLTLCGVKVGRVAVTKEDEDPNIRRQI